jgi:hypothetical protein
MHMYKVNSVPQVAALPTFSTIPHCYPVADLTQCKT